MGYTHFPPRDIREMAALHNQHCTLYTVQSCPALTVQCISALLSFSLTAYFGTQASFPPELLVLMLHKPVQRG